MRKCHWPGYPFAHCGLAIALAWADPERLQAVLPGAAGYWEKQLLRIRTGQDPEYELAAWLPAQIQLLGAVLLYSFTSFGAITFYEGFHQIDWMNFYNGRLLSHSVSPVHALLWGWHPWSVFRGAGYVFLSYEAVSLSLQWVSGVKLSPWSRRRWRWIIGLACLLTDGLLKMILLEPARAQLLANLHP